MKGLFKSSLIVALALFTKNKMSNAAPIPDAGEQAAVEAVPEQAGEYDYHRELAGFEERQRRSILDHERRSLASDVKPFLQAIQPIANGASSGLKQGAGNIKAAVSYAGSVISHEANSGADVVYGGLEGIAGTVERVPKGAASIVSSMEHGRGPLGTLLKSVFGRGV